MNPQQAGKFHTSENSPGLEPGNGSPTGASILPLASDLPAAIEPLCLEAIEPPKVNGGVLRQDLARLPSFVKAIEALKSRAAGAFSYSLDRGYPNFYADSQSAIASFGRNLSEEAELLNAGLNLQGSLSLKRWTIYLEEEKRCSVSAGYATAILLTRTLASNLLQSGVCEKELLQIVRESQGSDAIWKFALSYLAREPQALVLDHARIPIKLAKRCGEDMAQRELQRALRNRRLKHEIDKVYSNQSTIKLRILAPCMGGCSSEITRTMNLFTLSTGWAAKVSFGTRERADLGKLRRDVMRVIDNAVKGGLEVTGLKVEGRIIDLTYIERNGESSQRALGVKARLMGYCEVSIHPEKEFEFAPPADCKVICRR